MKICSKCKIEKPKNLFYRSKREKDGLCFQCKACVSNARKKYVKTPQGKIVKKRARTKYNNTTKGKEAHKNDLMRYYSTPHGSIFRKEYNIKYNHGITLEEYNAMLEAQGGCCAICGTNTPGGQGRFHVDHDHNTGKIRGLLCLMCNSMLGYSRDSTEIHKNAIKYLNRAIIDSDLFPIIKLGAFGGISTNGYIGGISISK